MSIILALATTFAFAILIGMHFIQKQETKSTSNEGSCNNELEWECSKCSKINTQQNAARIVKVGKVEKETEQSRCWGIHP